MSKLFSKIKTVNVRHPMKKKSGSTYYQHFTIQIFETKLEYNVMYNVYYFKN